MTSSSPIELHKSSITFLKSACITLHNFIDTYIHTYRQTDRQTDRHTDRQTYIRTCMHTCIHAYMHACIHACIHAYMYTCKHANMHTCIHANKQTNERTNERTNCKMGGSVSVQHTVQYSQSALSLQFSQWSLPSFLFLYIPLSSLPLCSYIHWCRSSVRPWASDMTRLVVR